MNLCRSGGRNLRVLQMQDSKGKVKMKHFMETITRALIAHMRDAGYLDRVNTTQMYKDGKLHYDRAKFIRQHASFDAQYDDKETMFDTDLETLAIQILQMVHHGAIIYTDDKGNRIRNDKIIKELHPRA